MQQITVQKKELLKTIKENRKIHVAEYNEAIKVYRESIIDELTKRQTLIQLGGEIDLSFHKFPAPTSQEKTYDQAIRMLEFSVDTNIVLTDHEFAQYVMDEWNWSNSFKAVTSHYNNKR